MGNFSPTPENFLAFFINWYNKRADEEYEPEVFIDRQDAYVVWFSYILGRAKCLVSTTIEDGRYWELTYNSETKRVYIDEYIKVLNRSVCV